MNYSKDISTRIETSRKEREMEGVDVGVYYFLLGIKSDRQRDFFQNYFQLIKIEAGKKQEE
ncbi:MAG: hypothetical protein RL141_941, partial [Candidatus Parcubacteria bacterium]